MATEPDSSTHSTGPVSSAPASSQAISIGIQSSSLISSHATMKDWETVSPSIRAQWILSTRSGLATGWFWAHGYDVQARTTGSRFGPTCWLCCHCIRQKAHKPKVYVSSNTRNIEGHLGKAHNISHPDPAKAKWHPPERPRNQASLHGFTVKKRKADDFRDELAARFDKAHFQRLLVQWIADANLSFRLSEHEALHKMLEYLNPLVRETSAHLTHKTIRTRLVNEFHAYKSHVIDTLSRSPSKVHIAFDGWTSRNRHSFFSMLFSLTRKHSNRGKLSWVFLPSLYLTLERTSQSPLQRCLRNSSWFCRTEWAALF